MRMGLLAVSAFGTDVLDLGLRQPELKWRIHEHTVGDSVWRSRIQQYEDPRWQSVWRHVVTGELLQAIGRLRPLSNSATIYVLTCEPLASVFDVQAVYASDLFPEMCLFGRRKDFVERVKEYAAALRDLVFNGESASNANVCRRLGLKDPNGLKYRELAEFIVEASL